MMTGICFKGLNTLYFRDNLSFFFEFVPQFLFMLALVGFMVLLIFVKWITPERLIQGKSNKPLIITSIIEMCMLQTPSFLAFESQELVQQVKNIRQLCVCLYLFVIGLYYSDAHFSTMYVDT